VIVEDFSDAQLGVTNRVREKEVRPLLWKKSPMGWVKVNCDASLNLAMFRVGLGVAIRDHDGCLIAAKSLSIEGAVDPEAVEATTFIHGVSLCRSLGFQKLILEGDAKVVVNALLSKHVNKSHFGHIIDELRVSLHAFPHWQRVFIPKESNMEFVWQKVLANTSFAL
jgi:ribonuclease HI